MLRCLADLSTLNPKLDDVGAGRLQNYFSRWCGSLPRRRKLTARKGLLQKEVGQLLSIAGSKIKGEMALYPRVPIVHCEYSRSGAIETLPKPISGNTYLGRWLWSVPEPLADDDGCQGTKTWAERLGVNDI